jgi:hypothetical protein
MSRKANPARVAPAARLDEVFEQLRRSIFDAYTALVEHNQDHTVTIGSLCGSRRMNEQERRQSSLKFIDEVLDRHPFASFSAVHLELLELMMAYWREAEVEAGAPSPDSLH